MIIIGKIGDPKAKTNRSAKILDQIFKDRNGDTGHQHVTGFRKNIYEIIFFSHTFINTVDCRYN